MRRLIMFIWVAIIAAGLNANPVIREIRTASNNVLVVFLHDTNMTKQLNTNLPQWKINGEQPLRINRYSMESDTCDNHVYLETSLLREGTEYKISTPYGDTTVLFRDDSIFCEAIKTNQAAYSALSKNNYANFAIWLGDGGGKQISGALPEYEVYEQYTGKVVANGVLSEVGNSGSSGDYVYKISLAEVPEGGPYKIVVKGYGCSHPFGVGGIFSKRLAYTMFRAQYYQRCGCPIKSPYGMDIRQKPCHSTIYKFNGSIGEANILVSGSEPTFKCYGGYHDAGDADRRAYHMSNPIINLMIYEAFPDLFYDGQYNIPDKFDEDYNIIGKGNGIPDIIDEAVWGTLIWEFLQNEDGSIQWGTETKGYPEPFDAPLDLDNKKYGTVRTSDTAAAIGAGLFLHLARIIKPYDTAYSRILVQRAEKSFDFVSKRMAAPEKLYYYVQKYLIDGDNAAHEQIKSMKNLVDSYSANVFGCNGYSLNDNKFDNPAYFFSYVVEKERSTDSSVVAYFKSALKAAADVNLAELPKYAYPVGNNPTGTSWGHNVMQPLYSCAPLLHWSYTKEQKYMDGACALMNYLLGQNPLGISYVTGLGFHQVHNPHDRECAYTIGKGWGPKPGITIFGPGVLWSQGGAGATTFPSISTLPKERQFGDDRNSISSAEFTIFETMSHNALFTVLSNGGTWDESVDPYASQQVSSKGKMQRNVNQLSKPVAVVSLGDRSLKIALTLSSSSQISGGLYTMNGAKVMNIDLGRLNAGLHSFTLPVSGSVSQNLAGNILICKLSIDNRFEVSTVFNRMD